MLFKLSLRNIKRQIRNYAIYFVTVVMSVALMFAVNSLVFNKEMMTLANNPEVKKLLIMMVVFVSVITAFVLSYATSFMLRLRSKEFGLYLTLGMTKSNITAVFITETVLLSLTALLLGLFGGIFIYQGLMSLLLSIMKMPIVFSSYSLKAITVTIYLSIGVFTLSSVASYIHLKRSKALQLLNGSNPSRQSKHPVFWTVSALVSLVSLIFTAVQEYTEIKESLTDTGDKGSFLMIYIPFLVLFMFLFHFCAAKSVIGILLNIKGIASHGTNTFILRNVSGRINTDAAIIGFLSVLISFSVIGTNISMTVKNTTDIIVDRESPFDIMYYSENYTKDGTQYETAPSIEEAESIIESYADIADKYTYLSYSCKECGISLPDNEPVSFMLMSDFKEIISRLSISDKLVEPLDEHSYYVLTNMTGLKDIEPLLEKISLDEDYSFGGFLERYPDFTNMNYCFLVPDSAKPYLTQEYVRNAYMLSSDDFDGISMAEELSYEFTDTHYGYIINASQYTIRQNIRNTYYAFTGVTVISIIYSSVIFICMTLAILAMKMLSSADTDKHRYSILFRLGVSRNKLYSTLRKQLSVYFVFPFLLPMLSGIPMITVSYAMLYKFKAADPIMTAITTSLFISLILFVIYCLYYVITYKSVRSNITS